MSSTNAVYKNKRNLLNLYSEDNNHQHNSPSFEALPEELRLLCGPQICTLLHFIDTSTSHLHVLKINKRNLEQSWKRMFVLEIRNFVSVYLVLCFMYLRIMLGVERACSISHNALQMVKRLLIPIKRNQSWEYFVCTKNNNCIKLLL